MSDSEEIFVQDNSSLHKYRTEIPNIIEDLDLDPYAYRLYCYYKKVAGDYGKCTQKKSTISKETRMSPSVIKDRNKILSQPFPQLGGKPLITIVHRKDENNDNLPNQITIEDIWPENFQILSTRFSKNPPSVVRKPTLGRQKTTEEEPYYKKNDDEEEYYKEQPSSSSSVVVFLDEEKEEILKPLDLDDCAISFALRFSVEEIKTAIKAVSQKKDIHNYSSTFTAALRDKWQPTKTKKEIQRQEEERQEKEEAQRSYTQMKTYKSEIKSLAKRYQGKLIDGWDVMIESDEVVIQTTSGKKPVQPTQEGLQWMKVIVESKCC